MKKLFSAVLATTLLFCASASAGENWTNHEERDAVQQQENTGSYHNITVLYFDTGRVCESRTQSGTHCSNWNINPIQANFFVEKCEQHAKDKRLCAYYKKNTPTLN